MGDFGGVLVVFEVDQLSVFECVSDASVAEYVHDMKYISGFVVFQGCFEVAEGVEAYFQYPWVLLWL